jgi:hypothetical protein
LLVIQIDIESVIEEFGNVLYPFIIQCVVILSQRNIFIQNTTQNKTCGYITFL